MLSKLQVNYRLAENGIECLRLLNSGHSFDLILMDCHMPVLDGYQTTKKIREDSRFDDLYIAAMTAHALEGEREKCLQCGMNEFFSKPIHLEKLRALFKSLSKRVHSKKAA